MSSLTRLTQKLRSAAARIIQKSWKANKQRRAIRNLAALVVCTAAKGWLLRARAFRERVEGFTHRRAAKKIQRAFRSCHKELFYLRKRVRRVVRRFVPGGSLTCPITRADIADPVLNLCDGNLYDTAALMQWESLGNRTCPTTRKPLMYTSISSLCGRYERMAGEAAEALRKLQVVRGLYNTSQMIRQEEKDRCRVVMTKFLNGESENDKWECRFCNYTSPPPNHQHFMKACKQHFDAKHA